MSVIISASVSNQVTREIGAQTTPFIDVKLSPGQSVSLEQFPARHHHIMLHL
jgi:hypothetical protein